MAQLQDGNLVLDEGEELHFPVQEDSELAGLLTTRQITDLEDIQDFQFVQEWARGFAPLDRPALAAGQAGAADETVTPNTAPSTFTGNRLDREALLGHVLVETGGTVTVLEVANLVVPAGSTVVLNGRFVEVKARTVVIAGKLKFTENLVIRCNEIRGR